MFAGYTAINNKIIPHAAKRLDGFGKSKTPNNISKAPLISDSNNLKGSHGGMIETYITA